jgi:hypothetical protein
MRGPKFRKCDSSRGVKYIFFCGVFCGG